ncbi:MAG: endonuclease/exonuclease/phosphatase family protein [Steroidobacteraceae bacterium]
MRFFLLLLCIWPGAALAADELKLATWNLEWLIAPEAFAALRASCTPEGVRPPGNVRAIPCDVAAQLDRSRADFEALARYGRQLDADIVALQEVDGASAARRVFPGYRFCFTARRHVQNTGFAIRPGIPYRCGRDFTALSLGDSVRRGAELVVYPGERREFRLLSVHLKSGCGTRLLNDRRKECAAVGRQAGILEGWIDREASAGRPFAVLGDFNRNLVRDTGPARTESGARLRLWPEIDDGEPPEAELTNTATGARFVNCAMNQTFSGYIDYIVLSRSLAEHLVPGSFDRVTYRTADAVRRKLSDHCPVSVRLRMPAGKSRGN